MLMYVNQHYYSSSPLKSLEPRHLRSTLGSGRHGNEAVGQGKHLRTGGKSMEETFGLWLTININGDLMDFKRI